MDLSQFSADQLEQLSKDALAAAKKKREEARKELRRKVDSLIKESGFSFGEVFPELDPMELKHTLPVVYRHTDNPALTWTGQGRRPKWLVEEMAAGRTVEEFKVR